MVREGESWRLPPFWIDGELGARRVAWGVETLRCYFDRGPRDEYWYSGARFERIAGGGDRMEVANEITSDDVVAVSMLAVAVPGHASIRFLETDRAAIGELLTGVPTDIDLAAPDADQHIAPGSAADQLWSVLRRSPGTGRTTTSKLLARKRPRLLPVYDSVIADLIGLRDTRDYWREIRELLRSDARFVPYLTAVRDEAGLGDIALLRVFDVLVWMSSPRRRPPRPDDS